MTAQLGFHIPYGRPYHGPIELFHRVCNAMQVFIGSPKTYKRPILETDNEGVKKAREYVQRNNIFLVEHSPYIYNLANKPEDNQKVLDAIVQDIKNIVALGGVGTVVHVGKHLKRDKAECMTNMYLNIKHAIENTTEGFFILETPAGCGTELCCSTEELAALYDFFTEDEKKRVKICVDTCHIYSAGYDVSNPKEYIDKFEGLIGWKNVAVCHFNNSKGVCGCKADRHENITEGYISQDGMREFARAMQQRNIPLILETSNAPEELDYVRSFFE